MLLLIFLFFCFRTIINFSFDVITRNIGNLGFSAFLVFAIIAITVIPAFGTVILLHDRLGRKGLAASALLLSGLFAIFVGIVLQTLGTSNPVLLLVLKLISYFMGLIALNSTNIHTAEVLPTVVRGQSVLVLGILGLLVSIFSPQLIYLNKYWKPLSDIFIGVLLLLGSVISIFLPETYNKTLPVTLEDGEMFGKNEKVFEFTFNSKNKSLNTYC